MKDILTHVSGRPAQRQISAPQELVRYFGELAKLAEHYLYNFADNKHRKQQKEIARLESAIQETNDETLRSHINLNFAEKPAYERIQFDCRQITAGDAQTTAKLV